MNWLFFALLAYFLWSFANIFDKILVSKTKVSPIGIIMVLNIIYAVTFLIIPFIEFQIPNLTDLAFILLAGIILFISLVPYFKALSL